MPSLLDGVEFRDPARAREAVLRLGAGLPERIAARIQVLLTTVPDPDTVVRYLGRLRLESPSAFDRVASSPAALRCAVQLFSFSNFLSQDVLKNPERILQVANSGSLYRVLSAEEYEERLFDFLGHDRRGFPLPEDLARFRRRQLPRIVVRDGWGIATLSDITEELSNLADAILDVTYRRIREELVACHGEPRLEDGGICGFSVISLGKLGGKELNYSSDIDLMFVYGGAGETDGLDPVTNKEFYKKVANQYTALLSSYTTEGQCYRVDLRLRPDGTLGEICTSLEGARIYYEQRARDWEKQMLIKARVSAGEREPGTALLDFVEPLIYQSSLDFRALEAVSETRQRIGEKVAAKRGLGGGLDIKLSPGGIRDIEFLVQCLQRLHGGREQWVRHGGTMFALFRLRDKGLLSGAEYARLATAYQFLRHLEHRLQIQDDRQTHTLPSDPDELDLLARKMPPETPGAPLTSDYLPRRLQEHLAAVREIYERVIHAQKPMYYTLPLEPAVIQEEVETLAPASNLTRFLDQRAPQLAEAVRRAGLHRGRERFEHFLEKAFANPEVLHRLDVDAPLAAAVLDIFEHSPHFSDQLLRHAELLDEIGRPVQLEGETLDHGDVLRRFYRRQMLRIQTESILRAAPIFDTLGQTSALADRVIAAAYRIALTEAPPPVNPSYVPRDQMMVIALGRLGMREFDLGSDADLVFVIPDADAGEQVYWTGVAERMVQTLSSYTGEGVMFTVDTRLRPNGREGDLVQSEGAYKSYFGAHAEAWEGITYMKSRAVAGSAERATEFLHELQDVDWRRYGQSMRSRTELAEMRARLEREQGPRNPLKAGVGGYYDIDFALMYLRLKGAGIFYKVLNTPERIDVIEKMGHLEREDADFLREAATCYRAIDHGQRIVTGHAEGSLPTAQAQFEMLTDLVKRWTPGHMHQERLDLTLRDIRQRTREFFNRLFGSS
ncbi:MAG: glutamine-synthetase adenylyltransferase [Acidobacteriia bacterium]|nr:glutamine-synthetase adenylyltransferase [Terriglobia bacterium]